MLKIDWRIQPLVAKYGVRRNFRVVFPNGERADLTSADIIDDTVELSESVCSETVFRFGCIERSMISFECGSPTYLVLLPVLLRLPVLDQPMLPMLHQQTE